MKGTPELIISLAPFMEELLRLREENRKLRVEKFPPPKGLIETFAAGGWTLRLLDDGKWAYTIPLHECNTGGRSYDSAELAAVAALKRSAELEFAPTEDDE